MTITLAATQFVAGSCANATSVNYTIYGDEITAAGADDFKILAQGQLPVSPTSLYPVPAGEQTVIKAIHLHNTTAGALAVAMYVQGTVAANRIANFIIPANGSATYDGTWTVYDASGFAQTVGATGPQGIQGVQGIQGTPGNTGPPGEVPAARSILTPSGSGMSGGGDLSANRTLQNVVDGASLEIATNTMRLKADGTLNTHLAPMPSRTVKGNSTAGTAGPTDLTVLQLQTMLDAGFFNANDVGILTSNTGAQNVSAFNAWYATAPTFCTLFFPGSGFYDFNAELTLNRDIRLRVLGAGKGRSILRQTHAAGNLFNQTVAAYYLSFEELGFVASVTKTSGAAIRAAADTAYLDVNRCEFQNQFNGVEWVAATAGNVGTIMECLFNSASPTAGSNTDGAQIKINGSNINMMIQNCTINITGVNSTGMMVNQCGAVQVGSCDFIGGKNTLLVNATGVVSALYFTNVFFDQATLGSTVKFMGTFAISRTKFVACGITNGGGSGLVALEIAGTGTGTGIPEAIDFDLCDFYNNGFAGTTTGILVTGCRGLDLRNSRIAGFTVGIDLTPYNANGVTNFGISGCTIGPTENFAGNGTGIRINTGSFQFGSSHLTNNDLSGNTTSPLVNNGTFAVGGGLVTRGNIGLLYEPVPLIATPANPAAVETIVQQIILPINSLQPGATVRFVAAGIITATTPTLTARIRCGTLGTIGDAVIMATPAVGCTTALGWQAEGYFTCRGPVGAACPTMGQGLVLGAAPGKSAQAAAVNVNTTAALFISFTLQAAGTTPVLTIVSAFSDVIRQ